jgi:hypothetical protein
MALKTLRLVANLNCLSIPSVRGYRRFELNLGDAPVDDAISHPDLSLVVCAPVIINYMVGSAKHKSVDKLFTAPKTVIRRFAERLM